MSNNQNKNSIHPLIATAAGAVILASVVGVAAMTGLFAKADEKTSETIVAASSSASAMGEASAQPTVVGNSKPVVAAKPKPRPTTTVVHQQDQPIQNEKPLCMSCGTVQSITSREVKAEKGSGVGAVAGALLGGVLGNQVGGGNGRKLATVAGAIGGGMAGNEIEKRKNSQLVYEVKVVMDNGEVRTFNPRNAPEWRSGDKVKVVDGQLTFQ